NEVFALPDMSSKVAFQVHYGDFYRITHDSYGVNLSALERRQCSLDKPLERSFESIRKCLHKMFNVNSKTHLLTVHTLTSWEANGDFWELTHINSTEEWQHYMYAALESGCPLAMVIQNHQKTGDLGEGSTHTTSDCNEEMEEDKEEENVQAPEPEPQPQGLADEGERILGIVEEMEKEDQDAQIIEQCGDSSNDEDDERFLVLGEWRKEGFGNPVVQ